MLPAFIVSVVFAAAQEQSAEPDTYQMAAAFSKECAEFRSPVDQRDYENRVARLRSQKTVSPTIFLQAEDRSWSATMRTKQAFLRSINGLRKSEIRALMQSVGVTAKESTSMTDWLGKQTKRLRQIKPLDTASISRHVDTKSVRFDLSRNEEGELVTVLVAIQTIPHDTRTGQLTDVGQPDSKTRTVDGVVIVGSALTDDHVASIRRLTDEWAPENAGANVVRNIQHEGPNRAINIWQGARFQSQQTLVLVNGEWKLKASGGGLGTFR